MLEQAYSIDEVSPQVVTLLLSNITLQKLDLNALPSDLPLHEEIPPVPMFCIYHRQGEPDPDVLVTEFMWTAAQNFALMQLHPVQQRLRML